MKRILFFTLLLVFTATSAWAQPNLYDPLKIIGSLDYYEGNFSVDGVKLNLGNGSVVDQDYDGNGLVQPVSQELLNLRGTRVIISGYRDRDPDDYDEIYVNNINGLDFANPKCNP